MSEQAQTIWIGFILFGETTARYLPSFLQSLSGCVCRLVAFDNTPEPDNANTAILAQYPEVRVYRGDGNLGFGAAYNRLLAAARAAGADYFFIVNPDTVIETGALEKLSAVLRADPRLGSVAPKLRRFNPKNGEKMDVIDSAGLALVSGLRFIDLGQGETDHGQYDQADILGPSGAAGLFRLSALEAVRDKEQYFDEHLFMYKEDCDLAYRLRLAGFGSRLVSEAVVYHDRTASGGRLWARFANRRERSRQVNVWAFTNQHLLWIKYWRQQTIMNKAIIIWQAAVRFVAALLFEPYLLSAYRGIRTAAKTIRRY